MVTNESTVKEVQQFIKDTLVDNERVECPCCYSTIGKYKRRINKAQALFLKELFIHYISNRKALHAPFYYYKDIQDEVQRKYKKHSTDYAKLADWDLIVSKGDIEDSTGVSSGYWSLTKEGVRFLKGEISVPKYLYQTSQGQIYAASPEGVHISDFFPNFNFNDIK